MALSPTVFDHGPRRSPILVISFTKEAQLGHLTLDGPEQKLISDKIGTAFDQFTLKSLIDGTSPAVSVSVSWFHPGGTTAIIWEVIQRANQHGVLDQVLAAVANHLPSRPDLRSLALHFSTKQGWNVPLVAHGMELTRGLEQLTSHGRPFLDTTRLVQWLIGVERQVCQVRCGNSNGTGFLVGPDLVLTCHHVVANHLNGSTAAADVRVRFDYRSGPDGCEPGGGSWIGIDPGWTILNAPHSPADLTLEGEPTEDELDYALLKLTARVGEQTPDGEDRTRGWVDLSLDVTLPAPGSPILIVQHPGRDDPPPAQMPLQITFATPGFEGQNANSTRIRYKPSTKPGSSGSPVFDRELRAVALHHNRGQINPEAVGLVSNNRGIPLAQIRAALSDEVRALLTAPGG